MKKIFKHKKAFTLAEVLITLVIIGVIAAITVPMLNQNTNKQEIITKLKKTFSTLSQATDQIIMEEGPATEWATSTNNIYTLYKDHLNLLKDCGSSSGCFPQGRFRHFSKSKYTSNLDERNDHYKIILSDGTQVIFSNEIYPKCTKSNPLNSGSNDVCSHITVDINGQKSPNTIGYDIFDFVIKEKGLFPAGCDDNSYCSKDVNYGYACTCQAVMDGNLDY